MLNIITKCFVFYVSIQFPLLTFAFFCAYGELLIDLSCQGGDRRKAPAASTVQGDCGQSPTRSRSVGGDRGSSLATTPSGKCYLLIVTKFHYNNNV